LESAREIAPHCAAHPNVEAVYDFSSVSYGCADEYSDLELGVIWSESPTESELAAIAETVGATTRQESRYIAATHSAFHQPCAQWMQPAQPAL
jgi:hypothetical protein